MAKTKKRKKRRKMTGKERAISAFVILLGALAVGLMGFEMLMDWKPLDNEEPIKNPYLLSPSNVLGEGEETNDADEYVNILCLAFDESESLTDVMMLVSLNKTTNEVNVLQMPRDSFIYGLSSTNKLNSAYTFGGDEPGVQNVIKCINLQFQLRVDYYITIGIDDIIEIVDKVGGVTVDVPDRIIWSANEILEAGKQTLTGEQAMWFVRYRKAYVQKDIGRQKTQRIFLAACMNKAKNLGVSEVINLIPTVSENLNTNMSIGEMKDLAQEFMSVDMSNCRFLMVPGDGQAWYDGQSVYGIYKQSTADMLNEYFRYNGEYVSAEDLDIFELSEDPGNAYEEPDDFQSIIDGDVPDVPRDYSDAPEYYN